MSTQPIPDGFHTVTPYLVVRDAAQAIEYYERAFGAREIFRSVCEESQRVLNARLRLGDSMIMLHDEFPERGCRGPAPDQPSPVTIHLYLESVDDAFERAVSEGATALLAPSPTFWGDRFALVEDPFGHRWSMATHLEDFSEEEVRTRAKRAFSSSATRKS